MVIRPAPSNRTATAATSRPSTAAAPLSVSQVTALVAEAIKSALPTSIRVVGEISNFKRHTSGHLYLTLKDSASELSCVCWRSAAEKLKFEPADGMQVIATGNVAVFERSGRYQLYIRRLEPRGIGALELAFRRMCEKLQREGLFDESRKQPLPLYPMRVAVVTSPTSAAIADILRTLSRRFPCAEVLLYPVRVQGPGAAAEIAGAVEHLNRQRHRLGGVDVMIVGRGGGSLEDLWAFNEEVVARAIFASRIPVISAVGHEVDLAVADLVADVRAATPTAAAELAVPVRDEVLSELAAKEARIGRAIRNRLELAALKLDGIVQRTWMREPLAPIQWREQIVDEWINRLQQEMIQRWRRRRRRLDTLEPVVQRIAPHAYLFRQAGLVHRLERRIQWTTSRLQHQSERQLNQTSSRLRDSSPAGKVSKLSAELRRLARSLPAVMEHRTALLAERVRSREEQLVAMGYKSVLGRGFSITRVKRGAKVVRSVHTVRDQDRIVTELADGTFESQVVNRNQLELFE